MAKGFEFINNTHLAWSREYMKLKASLFLIIQEYNTKEIKDCVLEGHVKYIDIQYIIQGVELMELQLKKIKSNN
jgi:beta-galactosidase beta subunit